MSTSATTTAEPSQRRKTALAVVRSFDDWNIPSVMKDRSPSCVHYILPTSLNRPPMNNEAYEAYFAQIIPYFRNFNLMINDIIEDEKENKVVMWAHSTADTVIGPYANEYFLVFYMNEAGDKVDKILEFVDSTNSVTFFPKLRKYIEETEGKAKES